MTNSTRTTAGARFAEAAGKARDGSRQFAADAAGRIASTVRDMGEGVSDLARAGTESVTDATIATQRQLGRYARAARRQAGRRPLQTALIGAGVAAAGVALVLAVVRSRRTTH